MLRPELADDDIGVNVRLPERNDHDAPRESSGGGYQNVFKRLELRSGGRAPSDSIRMGDRLRVEVGIDVS